MVNGQEIIAWFWSSEKISNETGCGIYVQPPVIDPLDMTMTEDLSIHHNNIPYLTSFVILITYLLNNVLIL